MNRSLQQGHHYRDVCRRCRQVRLRLGHPLSGAAQYQVRIRRKYWPRLNRTFERLPDAEAAVRAVEDQMQLVGKSATEKKLARYKQAQVVTLGDFLRKRLKIVEAKDPKSADAYRLRALLECFLAELPIADLQPAHFEAYIES